MVIIYGTSLKGESSFIKRFSLGNIPIISTVKNCYIRIDVPL